MSDLRELLRHAAPEPAHPYDPGEVRRRASRLGRRRAMALGISGLAAIAVAAVGLSWLAPPRVAFTPADQPGEMPSAWTDFVLHAWLDGGLEEDAYEEFADRVRSRDGIVRVEVLVADSVPPPEAMLEAVEVEVFPEVDGPIAVESDAEVLVPLPSEEEFDDTAPLPPPRMLPPPLPGRRSVGLWVSVADVNALRTVRVWLEEQPEVVGVEIPECAELSRSVHHDLDTVRHRLAAFGCEDDAVALAAGEVHGVAWVFVASREQSRALLAERGDETVHGWCYGITRADGSASRSCVYDDEAGYGYGLAQFGRQPLGLPGSPEALYGRVSPETAVVEALQDGQVVASYTPLDGGAAGRFVFGFLPDGVEPDEMVARDTDGNELERVPTFPPPPPDFGPDDPFPDTPPMPPPDPDAGGEPLEESELRQAPLP